MEGKKEVVKELKEGFERRFEPMEGRKERRKEGRNERTKEGGTSRKEGYPGRKEGRV
jgi:hypothetical protein